MTPSAFRHSKVLPVAHAQSRTLSRRSMEIYRLATGIVFLLATLAYGQNSQFVFDATGNLFAQASESLALPQMLGQPQMQVVIPGDSASFSVLLANTSGVSYQWSFGGTNIPGATSDTLLITNVSTANQGFYFVVVSNAVGSTASGLANLYIDSRGCGMPDSWQLEYFGNTNQNALGDYDGSGVANLQDFLDGTNPTNAASNLYRITLYNDGGGTVVFSPNQTAYTYGQVVTLTAVGSNTTPFNAWTGDVVTRSDSISVVMITNKYLYAHFTPITFQWTNGASGDWYTVSNWSPNLSPGFNDSIILVAGGTITMNSNVDLTDVTFGLPGNDTPFGSGEGNAPTLTGSGVITVHGTLDWESGTMAGSGQTIIAPGATLNFDNPGEIVISGRTLENQGDAIWSGLGSISVSGVITNDVGALFAMLNPSTMDFAGGSVSRFDNAGTLITSTNVGATSFDGVEFDNYGTVNFQSGTFALYGGGTNTGTISVPADTTLNLGEGFFFASGSSSIAGAGNLTVSGAFATLAGTVNVTGPLVLSGGSVDFTGNYIFTNTIVISDCAASFDGTGIVAPPTLTLSGSSGALGGSNVVTVGSVMNWTGGSLNGTGRMVISPGATLNIVGPGGPYGALSITSYTLDNGGTTLWSGGIIEMNGGVITNEAGALFQIQNPASIFDYGGSPRFDNAGTVRITGSGTNAFYIIFNNYNDTQIQGGTLQIDGGLNNGTMEVPAATTFSLGSGTFNASPPSSISGAGNFTVTADASATLSGLLNVSGTHTFSGGFAELNGNYVCTNNTMIIAGGTASFDGTGIVAPSTLTLSSGTLGGSNVVTVGSVMNWTGGSLNGTGRTVILPRATLNIAGPSGPYGAVSITSYTLDNAGTTLWSSGNIEINSGVITNEAGALFQIQNPGSIYIGGGSPRFDNAGTVRKSVSTGTATIGGSVPFTNYGTVDIQSGFLAANGGYVSSSNAVLNCALSGTLPGTNYGQLQVAGSVTLNGTLSVSLTNNYIPTTNDSFTLLSAGTRNGTFSNFIYPSNAVRMQLSNTTNSVIVRATNVLVAPQPLLFPLQLSGSNVTLTWTAVSNTIYRAEFNPGLNASNWNALPGDVTAVTNVASKLDILTPSNRFYRIQIIP